MHVCKELKWRYLYSTSEMQINNFILFFFFLTYHSISTVLFLIYLLIATTQESITCGRKFWDFPATILYHTTKKSSGLGAYRLTGLTPDLLRFRERSLGMIPMPVGKEVQLL